uniref:TGACG-sequence-specific DNA-binding protein TGA-1B n=1 Tax=Cajanus cajan TaxID=3821 RepID=A0A151TAQ1_CAJCA|nr:TGACG-sequence-specific DNA-binding protein TGA-1B [Cajanus cajan]
MTRSMDAVEPPPPASDLLFDDFSAAFDNLPFPSMDSLFNTDALPSASDLEFGMDFDGNGEFEITFEDLDNICIPSDADDFLLPDACNPSNDSIHDSSSKNPDCQVINSDSPHSVASAVSGDRSPDVSRFFNSQASDSVSEDDSCKQGSHDAVDVKASSPETEFCDREESSNEPVSSHGSGNGGSGVYEAMNSPSPDYGSYERDITSSRAHAVMENGVKLEEIGDLKRKKEGSEGSAEKRTSKYRRFSSSVENKTEKESLSDVNAIDDDDEKRKARLMRNRESAQLSRQRKKHYVEELEEKVRSMNSIIADLSSKISYMVAENATLRQQVGAGVMCPPPAAGMYPHHPPMAPMPYPWMPCAPYVVKPQGSQVPLVPIPRLKPQQPASAPKGKKSESKKAEVKTKKVASISLLGLFFFIMLFGGLVPLVDFKFGGLVDNVPGTGMSSYVSDRVYGHGGGKVWPLSNGHRNGSERDEEVGFSNGRFSVSDRVNNERGRRLGEEKGDRQGPDDSGRQGNASEPLVASLYVPRNDKMVKIDGNLIIHSIMASEKAMASQTAEAKKDKRETGLAIHNDWDSALAIPESSATDGKMQQWFREGLAGPMLSSGMCTEVFQFDVSPSPGAIVPATSVANVSNGKRQNATTVKKTGNRRTLHGLPDTLTGSSLNITEEHVKNLQKNHLGNKSSMVVSVLVDPKEAGDGDVDGMMRPKSLSRIFVVVLIDSVKYVTYSCGLPRASPHLVTAGKMF